jgi:hypothetical protein
LYFSFGEQIQTGELALDPADETDLEIALALQRPPAPPPPFSTLPVFLGEQPLGVIEKIVFAANRGTVYQFRSVSGNTFFSASTVDAVLRYLADLLGLASPSETAP